MKPHRVVDNIAGGVVEGARGIGNGLVNTVKSAGSTVMNALDKPFAMVTDREGPHRAIDRAVNGGINAAVNAVDNGLVRSIQMGGEAIMKALDHPPEQTGLPPDLPFIKK
jgi:phage-related protein